MDCGSDYVKMCDCPEIHGAWIPEEGDFYVLGCKRDKSPAICILGCHWNECEGCSYEVHELKDECVWLPRIDQLQEMLKYPDLGSILRDVREFWMFNASYYPVDFVSMEQLWLAFVMFELHRKRWDWENGQWVTK